MFSTLDSSRIETGLLSDYGKELVSLDYFNGVLTDSNFVNISTFYKLYCGLYSSKIGTNANLLPPDSVIFRVKNATGTNSEVSVAMMQFNYNSFKDSALLNGLAKVENNRIFDLGTATNPYNIKKLFAVAPQKVVFDTAMVSLVFRPELWFSNTNKTVQQMSVKFGDETGFLPATWNTNISHTFNVTGKHLLVFKLIYTDGEEFESKTEIFIRKPFSLHKNRTNITIDATSEHSGGTLQIRYAPSNCIIVNGDTICTGMFKKTLIIADVFDGSNILSVMPKIDLDFLLQKMPIAVLDTYLSEYDIVYVDNNNGVDDIFRNAKLFEYAVDYVNAHKADGNYENVVLGLSMGGLVSSIALRKMELSGKEHNVCKNISLDSPHKGANVPVGIQAMIRHIENLEVNLFYFITIYQATDIDDVLGQSVELLNSPAAKQMLIYYLKKNYEYDNSVHNTFMYEYERLGVPQQSENIALISGSNNGTTLFPPGAELIAMNKEVDIAWWKNLLIGLGSPLSLFTNFPELILNIIPGNSSVAVSAQIHAIPNQSVANVYHGEIIFKKKIFWFIPSQMTLSEATVKSTADMLPIDGAPGGTYSIQIFGLDNNRYSDALDIKANKFCFVPTVSALELSNWKSKLTSNLSSAPCSTYYYDMGYTPFEKYFYQSSNYVHVIESLDFGHALSSIEFLLNNIYSSCKTPISDADLYVKDSPSDFGLQSPFNHAYYDIMSSPDIWIEDLQGNQTGLIIPNHQYNICVRVRNRTNELSNGSSKIFIHWNRDNYNSDWRTGWDANTEHFSMGNYNVVFGDIIKREGSSIPPIKANGYIIHREAWTAPDDINYSHNPNLQPCFSIYNSRIAASYGFLAKINDGNPISNERSSHTPLANFVWESNNIAVNKVALITGKYGKMNFLNFVPVSFKLEFRIPANASNEKILQYADVYILPDDILLEQIKNNQNCLNGLKLTEKGLLLTSASASIKNLVMDSNMKSGFGVFVEFLSKEIPETSDFGLNVLQVVRDSIIVDIMPFVAVRDMDRYFAVKAHAEALLSENKLTLQADALAEPAQYVWYDKDGNNIGSGLELSIDLPAHSQWYKLEVIAEDDNYKDIDSAYVNIPLGFITNISPNPANSNNIKVEYFLSDAVESASLWILDNVGNVQMNYPVDITQKEMYIGVNGLLPHSYSVVLIANNTISDSKILIIQ